jgi:dolichol-phosphate mannosyltransferase
MKNVTIVTPTYNEKDNINDLLSRLKGVNDKLSNKYKLTMLFVDDNSPDGTAQIIKENSNKQSYKVDIIERPGKLGLGTAYTDGFKRALKNGADFVIQMDADFSHEPESIIDIVDALEKYDFVIGSRYIKGGTTPGWSKKRRMISSLGNIYSRIILGLGIHDWTGGFNGWNKHVLEKINLDSIKSNGFGFQFEMKYKAKMLKFTHKEVPICFKDRAKGKSKFSKNIMKEASLNALKLRLGIIK